MGRALATLYLLLVSTTLPSVVRARIHQQCPGIWVNAKGMMQCQCPDGSAADLNADPITCPEEKAEEPIIVWQAPSETLICSQPLVEVELALKAKIDGTRKKTIEIADALNFLHRKFCRVTLESLEEATREQKSDTCYQMSGNYRGETVYWGECFVQD